jgi:ketosteroid isomerase-like protein
MGIDTAGIRRTIIDLERSFNERWSAGDDRGYLDAFTDDVSYFDPILERILVGRDEVRAYIDSIYSDPRIVRSDYGTPSVHVSDGGDFAVLAYNLRTYVLDEDGHEVPLRAWNATHAYRLVGGRWRIAHSNWAFSQTVTGAIAS